MTTAKHVPADKAPTMVPESIDFDNLAQYKASEMYPHYARLIAEGTALQEELTATETSADALSVAIATILHANKIETHTIGGVVYKVRKVNDREEYRLYPLVPRKPKPKKNGEKPSPDDI